ncbi:hypothetical protein MBLNU230_g4555t1 [Neophaeotheca triangularis]
MPPTVDVHTHIYPPSYMSLLRSRTTVPYIRPHPTDPTADERLIILPSEADSSATSNNNSPPTPPGRPIGQTYHSITSKLAFMNTHSIDISILSLANPWLDWLPPATAAETTRTTNDEIESLCADPSAGNRLYAFGTLPLSSTTTAAITAEISRLASPQLPHIRGVVMGTTGLGKGLDDPALDAIWQQLESNRQLVFLHPHYGLGSTAADVYGPRAAAAEYGHVLPLALGFPVETTVAVTRMLLAGVWDRFPDLKVLLAHSGGTLPFLAGRIESCIRHDGALGAKGWLGEGRRRSVWDVLRRNVYLDAVVYGDVGVGAAVGVSGVERVMFGTDHPFFPPLGGEEVWESVRSNEEAVEKAFGGDPEARDKVMGGNALRVFGIEWEG